MTDNEPTGLGDLMRQWAAAHGRKVQLPARANAVTPPPKRRRTAKEQKDRKRLLDELAKQELVPGRGGVDYGHNLDLSSPVLQRAMQFDHDHGVTHHGLPCCENRRNGDAG